MTQADAAQQLSELMTKVLGNEVDPTAMDVDLVAKYGVESMDIVEIVERVEEKFHVKIRNDEIDKIVTFRDLLNLALRPGSRSKPS